MEERPGQGKELWSLTPCAEAALKWSASLYSSQWGTQNQEGSKSISEQQGIKCLFFFSVSSSADTDLSYNKKTTESDTLLLKI